MNIIPFDFESQPVRSVVIDGNPWFLASDLCRVLDYQNGPEAIRDHVDPEDKQSISLGLPGRVPTAVNEAGVYSLVLGSKKPQARAFKRWLIGEVLPSIRATGGYGTDAKQQAALDALRRVHQVADAEVERATRHAFYKADSPRAQERIAASVAAVAARHGLDPAAVRRGLSANVQHVMAEFYGDPYAVRCIEREQARIEAEVSRRLKAVRRPARKPSSRR